MGFLNSEGFHFTKNKLCRLSTVPLVCKHWHHITRGHGAQIWQECSIDNSDFAWPPLPPHPPHDYFKVRIVQIFPWLKTALQICCGLNGNFCSGVAMV